MNPFKILGIDPTHDKMSIRRAYVAAAKKHHPDNGGESGDFQRIQTAYNSLIKNKLDGPVIETELSISLADFLYGCHATAILKHGAYRGTVLEFKVPPFSYPGTIIEFYDLGSTNQLVRVKITEIITTKYTRIDSNIVVKHSINTLEAELGITFNITNFDGVIHTFKVSPETTADRLIYTTDGAGFYEKKSTIRGNFTIIVEVDKKRYNYV
jgi:DnaJ-class molecular chaperone